MVRNKSSMFWKPRGTNAALAVDGGSKTSTQDHVGSDPRPRVTCWTAASCRVGRGPACGLEQEAAGGGSGQLAPGSHLEDTVSAAHVGKDMRPEQKRGTLSFPGGSACAADAPWDPRSLAGAWGWTRCKWGGPAVATQLVRKGWY